MNKIMIGLLVLMLVGDLGSQKSLDVEVEIAAIREVIDNALKEIYENISFEGWANYIVHEPYAIHAWAHKNGPVENKGWEKISALWKKRFERRLKNAEPSKIEVVYDNFTYKIWRDAAWVSFESYMKEDKEKDPNYRPWKTYCVFEKTKDGWKYVSWINFNMESWRETATK